MKLAIEHTDLEVLYHALGCLSPRNEAHKPLAILLARLEVQKERAAFETPRAQLKLGFELEGPELKQPLSELLSPAEAALVQQLTLTLGEEPRWEINFNWDGIMTWARVDYTYQPASGARQQRSVVVDRGRPDEMLLKALRQAACDARHDHTEAVEKEDSE